MKSELRIKPHGAMECANAVEVWHNGRMVAVVYGADGPGVRVISRHELCTVVEPTGFQTNVTAVLVNEYMNTDKTQPDKVDELTKLRTVLEECRPLVKARLAWLQDNGQWDADGSILTRIETALKVGES